MSNNNNIDRKLNDLLIETNGKLNSDIMNKKLVEVGDSHGH